MTTLIPQTKQSIWRFSQLLSMPVVIIHLGMGKWPRVILGTIKSRAWANVPFIIWLPTSPTVTGKLYIATLWVPLGQNGTLLPHVLQCPFSWELNLHFTKRVLGLKTGSFLEIRWEIMTFYWGNCPQSSMNSFDCVHLTIAMLASFCLAPLHTVVY